jgi:hypothetical protein
MYAMPQAGPYHKEKEVLREIGWDFDGILWRD